VMRRTIDRQRLGRHIPAGANGPYNRTSIARQQISRCNCDPVRPHVKVSNDAILNEGGQTTAMSLVGAHPDQGMCWGKALGHLLVVLPGNVSLQVWIGMTKWD
jgi:hypothetical protein